MAAGENRFTPELNEKKKSLNCYKTQHQGAQSPGGGGGGAVLPYMSYIGMCR